MINFIVKYYTLKFLKTAFHFVKLYKKSSQIMTGIPTPYFPAFFSINKL